MELPELPYGPPYHFYWIVGLDPASVQDYTGIVLLEHAYGHEHLDAQTPAWVRYCDHFRGTYPEQADFVRGWASRMIDEALEERLQQLQERWHEGFLEHSRFYLVCDATGPGLGLFQELTKQPLRTPRARVDVRGVLITGSGKATYEHPFYHAPQDILVTKTVIGIQRQYLRADRDVPGLQELLDEFVTLERRVKPSGSEHFGAYREHAVDDRFFALACAWWLLSRPNPMGVSSGRALI